MVKFREVKEKILSRTSQNLLCANVCESPRKGVIVFQVPKLFDQGTLFFLFLTKNIL